MIPTAKVIQISPSICKFCRKIGSCENPNRSILGESLEPRLGNMECNRDEASRAKFIAEGKMSAKDYSGAKKFALKAQNLYPGLEGISQMLTTIDVYVSAENKISGEVDWYGVLGVTPSADDESLRRQYRKLALVLHPDKNKSVGADGAFKLLSEAWSLLSDKAKRLSYNQRRGLKGIQQKVKTQSSGPSRANGIHSLFSKSASGSKAQHTAAPKAVPTPCHKRNDTFWTICHKCKMHYEYLKVYLNNTLLCPNCHQAFVAKQTAPPFSHSMSSNSATPQNHQGPSARIPVPSGRNVFNCPDFQHGQPSMNTSGNSLDPSLALAQGKLKRERDGSHFSGSFSKGETLFKKSRVDANDYPSGGNMAHWAAMGSFFGSGSSGSSRGGSEARWMHGFPGTYQKPKSVREMTPIELRKILAEKGRNEIQKKLKEWKSKTSAKPPGMKNEKVKADYQAKHIGKHHEMNGIEQPSASKPSAPVKNSFGAASDDVEEGNPVAESMNVPDPDFHDFDLDRSENSFSDNEVWAAYDDDDGMPRFYALINKVISKKPFKVKLSWLNSKTNSEFATIDWVGSGFYKTCGEFRVGRYEMNKSINSFSHKVKWFKGPRGTVQIFPKKGDVWALYTNWSPDWDEQTPDKVIHKYEMTLVLDDYNEEQGISVAPLSKVDGFRTVFYPQMDPEKIRRIPKEEMFRFSHQVPNYLLTGEEVKNGPEDCQELDPAATPVELLQVATEAEGPVANNNGDVVVTESQSKAEVG